MWRPRVGHPIGRTHAGARASTIAGGSWPPWNRLTRPRTPAPRRDLARGPRRRPGRARRVPRGRGRGGRRGNDRRGGDRTRAAAARGGGRTAARSADRAAGAGPGGVGVRAVLRQPRARDAVLLRRL